MGFNGLRRGRLGMSHRCGFAAYAGVALVAIVCSQSSVAFAGSRKALELQGEFQFLSEAPIERIHGTAAGAGVVVTDLADLSRTSGAVSVPVATMKTGSPIRDQHLHGESWLDSASHPK